MGGYADGVLGCATDGGEITIIQGWNWYAGADATAIGAGQYDFQTVVTHELGHALGLGHRTDATSVMYPTLSTDAVNRTLTTADLNVPDTVTGAGGLHAVPLPLGILPVSSGQASGGLPALSFDVLDAALDTIMAEWNPNQDFASRVANLIDTGSGPRLNGDVFLLADVTVFDDAAADRRTGGSGSDLFFANHKASGGLDKIADLGKLELALDL